MSDLLLSLGMVGLAAAAFVYIRMCDSAWGDAMTLDSGLTALTALGLLAFRGGAHPPQTLLRVALR